MKQNLPIGAAAEHLGVSEQTLRRWDKQGSFKASFISPGGHRHYSLADLEKRMKGLYQIAKEWTISKNPSEPPQEFYCPTSDIFKTRLEKMAREIESLSAIKEIGSIISSVAGEIGNNSFDHNIGNWPDLMGTFFAHDLGKRVVILADRGRGILTTLRAIKPELANDTDALRVAFTKVLTGRAPEHRGNGLKYVKNAVTKFGLHLKFQSGNAVVEIKKQKNDFIISPSDVFAQGCLTLLEF